MLPSLIGADRRRLERDPNLRGALLETFVATELRKQVAWSRAVPSLWHYRTRSGAEVDFLLETRDGRVVGVEVKAGATVRADDFRALAGLAEVVGDRFVRGVVLHCGTESAAFGPNLWALPVSALWRLASEGSSRSTSRRQRHQT